MKSANILLHSLLAASLLGLAGCNTDDGGGTGSMTLNITDAPVDHATRVVVEFTGVSLKPAGGVAVEHTFDTPRQIDLLALQGGGSEALLDMLTLNAGHYNWLRLNVNAGVDASDSFIELEDGSLHPLFIPSGNETGLKLVSGFVVPQNQHADFTVDFDLRKSVVEPGQSGNPYILRPTLRLVDNSMVGSIAGTVDAAIASDPECSAAVYIYEGNDVQPDDVGSANEPLTSAMVTLNESSGVYEYRVAFLTEGSYTAALTCSAGLDSVENGDDIAFLAPQNASVGAGAVTEVHFGN
jgi:hypothetical protein